MSHGPKINLKTATETEILARTLYGEGRTDKITTKEALAAVILNRARISKDRGGYWWGDTLAEICLRPWQFPCWNPDTPQREKLLEVAEDNKTFASCLRIARRALAGGFIDPTKGATHYHAQSDHPPWAWNRKPSAEIGRFLFYADVE